MDSTIFLDYRVSWNQFELWRLEQYSRCVLLHLTILIILSVTRYFRAIALYCEELWPQPSSIKFHVKNFLRAQFDWSKVASIKSLDFLYWLCKIACNGVTFSITKDLFLICLCVNAKSSFPLYQILNKYSSF